MTGVGGRPRGAGSLLVLIALAALAAPWVAPSPPTRRFEEVLYAHPAVAEAAVVGLRDPLMGEEVLAFVVLKRGAAVDGGALIEFCQARLAKYKCPKQIRFVESLPKSPIGKVLRKELRSLA